MNVSWIIPCRYVEVHDNLATIVGAGIDTYWVPTLPVPIQVPVAVRIEALPEELAPDVQHTVRNILTGPDGSVLSDLTDTGAFGGGQVVERPDYLQGVALATVVQFEAEQEGTYQFEHMVDDSSASAPIHVVQGPPPGFEPPPEA